MKLLHNSKIKIGGELKGKMRVWTSLSKGSVNSWYYTDKNWKKKRWSEWLKIQKDYKEHFYYFYKKLWKELIKKNILIRVDINQVVKLKKDWTNSKVGVIDIDNQLKFLFDAMEGVVFEDDNIIDWLIINRTINQKKYSNIEVSVYDFNLEEIEEQISGINRRYEKEEVLKHEYVFPNNISPTSFNELYTTVGKWWKKILSDKGKKYKWFLKYNTSKKWNQEGDFLIWLDFYIKNKEKRDLDNLLKATIDSFSWNLYKDDKYINTIIALKKSIKDYWLKQEKLKIWVFNRNKS